MNGLRDALAKAIRSPQVSDIAIHYEPERAADAILAHPAMVAALRATDVPSDRPAPSGLNSDVLAEALWAWGFDASGPVIRDDVKEPTEGQRRMARKIAIEYDRLLAATPDDGSGS